MKILVFLQYFSRGLTIEGVKTKGFLELFNKKPDPLFSNLPKELIVTESENLFYKVTHNVWPHLNIINVMFDM